MQNCLQIDDVRDFAARWSLILLGTSEVPHVNLLEGLLQNKVAGFRRTSHCVGFVQPKLDRQKVTPSFERLRTMVREHSDQMIRMSNFKAQNEGIEKGVLVKSQQRKERQR